MVKRLLAATVVLILTAGPCFGKDKCTEPTEFKPSLCPIKFPAIKKVYIEASGAKSPESKDKVIDCSEFKLTEKKVKAYFSLAMKTEKYSALEKLDWSPCYANGTLTFSNGKTVHWEINQGQAGMISINGWDDKDDKNWTFLYCPKCKFKPFVDTSDDRGLPK